MIRARLWVLLPQPMVQISKAQPVKGQKAILTGPAGPPEWNYSQHSYAQTNKYMYDWILLNTCLLINLFCNRSFVCNVHQVNTTLSLATNAGMMMTNLKAELPGYSMVWFDRQPITNVLSFGNKAKQYPI